MSKRILQFSFVFFVMLLIFLTGLQLAQSQDTCTPHMTTVTVGDDTLGNPKQTFNLELGCVENVFSDVVGYLPINTPVRFKNQPYFAIQGAITNYSGDGYIIGYQITHLITHDEVLYIIVFETSKFIRLKDNQFEVLPVAE